MPRRDIHQPYDFFEYVRVADSEPPADRDRIDVAILDMNHAWPNVGHDSLVHAVLESAEPLREPLAAAGAKVRVLSYDVRRLMQIPQSPNGRFQLYLGTGGPGHLDPRLNDGVREESQGIAETPAWEAPLFRLFDDILALPPHFSASATASASCAAGRAPHVPNCARRRAAGCRRTCCPRTALRIRGSDNSQPVWPAIATSASSITASSI